MDVATGTSDPCDHAAFCTLSRSLVAFLWTTQSGFGSIPNMATKTAEQRTKYFAEGVSAVTAVNNGVISVQRETRAFFLDIDSLKRAAEHVQWQIREGRQEIEFFNRSTDYHREIIVIFQTPDDALACLRHIGEAVRYVQERTEDTGWFTVPDDIFDAPVEQPTT